MSEMRSNSVNDVGIFYIDVQYFYQKKVKVYATTKSEAINIVRKMYDECEIVLDTDDFKGVRIKHADEDDTAWREM